MVAQYQRLIMGRRRGQQQLTQSTYLPAPLGGINALDGGASGSPIDALTLDNLIPQEFGCVVRHGYAEWCDAIPLGDGVKTIMPFNSESGLDASNKLFCATSDGIYEITTAGGTPTKRFDFAVKSSDAGWCSWHSYSNPAGHFLLICDLENGYVIYNAATDSFAAGTLTASPANPVPCYVTVWKNRVWFAEKDSDVGWYLPVGQVSGAATRFDFGGKFKYGGELRGIWNWTIDGGEGIDDHLVAISGAGDVVVYKGTDPASASTFQIVGSYWIGKVPKGRRFVTSFGGEMLILSTYGVLQMSKLLAGLPVGDDELSISYKVNPRLSTIMGRTITSFGWELTSNPREQLVIVAAPKEESVVHQQYVYNNATRAWARFVGVPYLTGESWQNEFYIGTADNKIFRLTGFADNVLLSDGGDSAQAIEWAMLTTFNSYGAPAQFKRTQFLRPQFIGSAVPTYDIAARYDFDLELPVGSPAFVDPGGALWDIGLWDAVVWGGGLITDQPPRGGRGLGRNIALVLRGRSNAQTTFIGTDVMFDVGGML